MFSRLLGPKCICGQGSALNPAGGAYSAPSDPLAGGRGLTAPPQKPLPALGLWPQILALWP